MYDILFNIIGHSYTTGDSMQQYIIYGCICLIIVYSVVFIDLIYRIFSHFWRGGK